MPDVSTRIVPHGNNLQLWRGDTLSIDITRLGDISARDKLWFTVKGGKNDADTGAQIQIEESAGLLYIAGGAVEVAAAGNGSITVTGAVSGDITVTLAAVESAKLGGEGEWYYDVQMLVGAIVTTLVRGRVVVVGDSTRVTS